MVIFEAQMGNVRFNRTVGAFEAQVAVGTSDGLDFFTARAYLPEETPTDRVTDALTEVARRRHEALRGGEDLGLNTSRNARA